MHSLPADTEIKGSTSHVHEDVQVSCVESVYISPVIPAQAEILILTSPYRSVVVNVFESQPNQLIRLAHTVSGVYFHHILPRHISAFDCFVTFRANESQGT